jgi:hypothetical protein
MERSLPQECIQEDHSGNQPVPQSGHETAARSKESGIRMLKVLDEDNPPFLCEIAQLPWVLYVKGDKELQHGLTLPRGAAPSCSERNQCNQSHQGELAAAGWSWWNATAESSRKLTGLP